MKINYNYYVKGAIAWPCAQAQSNVIFLILAASIQNITLQIETKANMSYKNVITIVRTVSTCPVCTNYIDVHRLECIRLTH